jgi:hypothetical protein
VGHAKVDFTKTLDSYRPGRNHVIRQLEVPPMQYVMVDGTGDPNGSPDFEAALATLYPVAYRLKFESRTRLGRDYVVMPLEGLWWADDLTVFTEARDKTRWSWTLMIMVPEWTTHEMVTAAVSAGDELPRPVRLQTLDEGRCVQALHVGPFDDEAGILAELHHRFVPDAGLTLRGTHHEIYLSDRRRVDPSRYRTILRQPVS